MPPKPTEHPDTKEETPKDLPAEQKFSVAELAAHSHRAFGCTPWAVHGALEPLKAERFTVAEAKAKIAAHLEKELRL